MKIKTITCHDVYNLGASLQAYALQTYLTHYGHDVCIIDYKPPYLSGHYSLWSVPEKYRKPIVRLLYLLAKMPGRIRSLKRKRMFDEFTRHYLRLTSRYHSFEELKQNPPEAEVYIAGSDQIWNTLFPNGRDASFYLDFSPKGKKRIAYAASFATPDVPDEYCPFVRSMLARMDAVSVREKSSLPLLRRLGCDNGIAVCDPVFLLSAEKWETLLKPVHYKPYVLVYDFEHSPLIRELAQYIAAEKGLKIVNVGPFRETYAQANEVYAGPLEFISLIYYSAYFISNSFHGTAFSLIFHKNFFVVNRTEGINERMKSLLSDLCLQQRIVTTVEEADLNAIDYSKTDVCLNELIANSKAYLQKELS